ncbi:MAG: hypothetical protein ACM3O4_05885 [Ignavibacteriales bacterium]
MKFPYVVCELNKNEIEAFEKYYQKNGKFDFEGVWFRDQREVNKQNSGWKNESDNRRKVIHFYDTYKIINNNLVISDSYLYVSERLPISEMNRYLSKIVNELENNYSKKDDTYYKDDLEITINKYDKHPIDENYIDNYETVDITIKTKNNNCDHLYDKLWKLSVKGVREKDKRGNPTYINDITGLKEYLPAQIELGCGPSIEAGIPPLYFLHEVYKVQRHEDGSFYFGDSDDLIYQVINDTPKRFKLFSNMIMQCLKAKPTCFHETIKNMYQKELFIGRLLNNNFDRLPSRIGIEEKILRIYNIETYFPTIEFDERAKSLICIGTHADRRRVQKQAREKGLKIIYVDCEGFYNNGQFENYLIEGAQENDLILKITATEFAKLLGEKFL